MRTINTYDSFDPRRLLEVRFELSDKPEYIVSFRSSYASLYEFMQRVHYKKVSRERSKLDYIIGEVKK